MSTSFVETLESGGASIIMVDWGSTQELLSTQTSVDTPLFRVGSMWELQCSAINWREQNDLSKIHAIREWHGGH